MAPLPPFGGTEAYASFPSAHVISVLQFGTRFPSHGTIEMPVWGPVLGKMDQANPQERLLRISNLSHYLETIQVK